MSDKRPPRPTHASSPSAQQRPPPAQHGLHCAGDAMPLAVVLLGLRVGAAARHVRRDVVGPAGRRP
eukprot:5940358-Prymnesium_polylepis.1